MAHNRKLVIGGAALVKARLKNDVQAMSAVRDELETLLLDCDFFAAAPFKWIGLIIRFGLEDKVEPVYQRISKTHGNLPISVEVDMKFDFFESLSHKEAKTFFDRFLEVESSPVQEALEQCSAEGVRVNWGIGSVAPFLRWAAVKLKTLPTAPDMQLPAWIRETDSYAKNLFEFDDVSKILTLRAAYFMGESFVRNFRNLHWTIGNSETAEANMPVVGGFQSGLEMAPILIAENLLRRVIAEPSKQSDVDKAVDYWVGKV